MTKVLTNDEFATTMREWHERNYGGWTRAARGAYNSIVPTVNAWIERGDRAAIYRNHDLGHRDIGQIVCVSFGSEEAQVPTKACERCGGEGSIPLDVADGEVHTSCPECHGMAWEAPPVSLPVDGPIHGLGWRYRLEAIFEGEVEEVSLDDAPEDEAYDEISTHDGGEA